MTESNLNGLRGEQIERIKQRDSFVNFTVVSIGIMLSAAVVGDNSRAEILLAVPWVTLALGWTFILNDLKVIRLSSYFYYVDNSSSSDGWEDWRRQSSPTWLENPIIGALVQMLIFIAPGLLAPTSYIAVNGAGSLQVWEIICLGAGFVLTSGLAVAVVAAANLRRSLRT